MDNELLRKIINDPALRRAAVREKHVLFFNTYLGTYANCPRAPFHEDLFELTENPDYRVIVVMAFRGSGKSTIITLSYPLWSILGKQKKKCVLIISQTSQQAKNHFVNIRMELQRNTLLKKDLGPFLLDSDSWGAASLELPVMGARIIAASAEQSIRGIRHGAYRPDLIICDDLEDTLTLDPSSRRFLYDWLKSEVFPAGDKNTRIIIVGNLVHWDSLLMKVARDIRTGSLSGVFRPYPLLDDHGKSLWPGKFNYKAIAQLKRDTADDNVWNREYLLNIRENPWGKLEEDIFESFPDVFAGHPLQRTIFEPTRYDAASMRRKYQVSAPFYEESPVARVLKSIAGPR